MMVEMKRMSFEYDGRGARCYFGKWKHPSPHFCVAQISYLLKPNKRLELEMDLEGMARSIGYRHPIMGLHMRGGDGCRYGIRARQFRCRVLADYIPHLRTMAMKYGASQRHAQA